MLKAIMLVGAGGMAGSVLRFVISHFMSQHYSSGLPKGTLAVNILGSLIMGLIVGLGSGRDWSYYLLAVGFCGGFTTFSAFSLEMLGMLRGGNFSMAALYLAVSVVAGIFMVWAGWWLAVKLKGI